MSGSVNAVYRESGTDLQAMFDEASTIHPYSRLAQRLVLWLLSKNAATSLQIINRFYYSFQI